MLVTFSKLFHLKVLRVVFDSSHLVEGEDMKSRDTFVAFDSNGSAVVLERKILSDGASAVSYEVVGGINGIVREEVTDEVVKSRLRQNITDGFKTRKSTLLPSVYVGDGHRMAEAFHRQPRVCGKS